MFRQRRQAFLSVGLSIIFVLYLPAFAADAYQAGCKYYASGNWQAAKSAFQQVIRKDPKSYKAQYQLANTLIQLKDYASAAQAYKACLMCNPDPLTAQNCRRAQAFLMQPQALPGAGSGSHASVPLPPPPFAPNKMAEREKTDQEKQADARKEEIMNEAEKQAKQIRDQAKQELTDLEQNGNYWVRDAQTGEVRTGVPSQIGQDIMREAEEKASRLLEEARRHCASIH
jgi:tetratricopeptide (TPR) repeat protein